MSAGFCDGLGYGTNTKAAIMRLGLLEIMQFCKVGHKNDFLVLDEPTVPPVVIRA